MSEKDGIIVLTDDDGKEVEFEHIDTVEMDDNYYVVLHCVEDPEDEVVILKFENDDADCEVLVAVDEDEAEKVLDKCAELYEAEQNQ